MLVYQSPIQIGEDLINLLREATQNVSPASEGSSDLLGAGLLQSYEQMPIESDSVLRTIRLIVLG